MRIGYFLSCEEYTPAELLEQARVFGWGGWGHKGGNNAGRTRKTQR